VTGPWTVNAGTEMLPVRLPVAVLLAALAGVAYVLIRNKFRSVLVYPAIAGTVIVLVTFGI
jgi:hypothetical protein